MFKEKCVTKRKTLNNPNSHNSSTLDARHQQMIQQLTDKQAEIDSIRKRIDGLSIQKDDIYQVIVDKKNKDETEDSHYNKTWEKFMGIQDDIRRLENQLVSREACEEEIEYYEKTANILFDYYSLLDEQTGGNIDDISMPVIRPPQPTKKNKKAPPPPGKSILLQLGLIERDANGNTNTPVDTSIVTTAATVASASATVSGPAGAGSGNDSQPESDVVTPANRRDKSSLVDEYISCIDQQQLHKVPVSDSLQTCIGCKVQYIANYYEGILYCPTCGQQEALLVEQNRPAQKQQNKETSHFSYKRINHLNEWVSQIQGKESTDIPNDIFDSILNEIRKERIMDPEKITFSKMREILKRLKLNRFYEHVPYIMTRIHGVPTPYFPPDLEEKLRHMFKEIQAPFLRHCPKNRKNFLSYSYVLYKFFQLLDKEEYLKFFPLLKSREKLACQDAIWRGVCDDLGWSFFPSV